MATKNKQQTLLQKYTSSTVVVLIALLLIAVSWAAYETYRNRNDTMDTKSRLAYVDGSDAVSQVSNFYRQYLANTDEPSFQQKLVTTYGSKNLSFYKDYYRHGFDPITCSTEVPVSVSASLVSTGPVATVNALATYPDDTTATITATVVLTDELKIDSITCPGSKGNLAPGNS